MLSDVVHAWEGWSNTEDAVETVTEIKNACTALLALTPLVDEETSEGALLQQGLELSEFIEKLGGELDATDVEHVSCMDSILALQPDLDERWPKELHDFLSHVSSDEVKELIFENHAAALRAAMNEVKRLVPEAWQKWGGKGSL